MDLNLNFDNTYAKELAELVIPSEPTKPIKPELIIFNSNLAKDLGLIKTDSLSDEAKTDILNYFSGNSLPAGSQPVAQAYAGHQFGRFSYPLGDGRALLLGEVISPNSQRFDLHFKGSGITPFSRGGDGKAHLAPMLREYLISEAMFALDIPTTRSLCVIATGDTVLRPEPLQGAILTRTASSHLRVGTFEFAAAQKNINLLNKLTQYAIQRHYSFIKTQDAQSPAFELLKCVGHEQIKLISQWMGVGFIHGVMNTDNMTISGETIDYGPCAFMDRYDPKTVFSSIDRKGRYAYGNQPIILQWNLARLAEALFPLIDTHIDDATNQVTAYIESIPTQYQNQWYTLMSQKLGLGNTVQDEDIHVIELLLNIMEKERLDWTQTFTHLTMYAQDSSYDLETHFNNNEELDAWLGLWSSRIDKYSKEDMAKYNPLFIPRNHIIESVLNSATEGDFEPFHNILKDLQNPYSPPSMKDLLNPAPLDLPSHVTYCGT